MNTTLTLQKKLSRMYHICSKYGKGYDHSFDKILDLWYVISKLNLRGEQRNDVRN